MIFIRVFILIGVLFSFIPSSYAIGPRLLYVEPGSADSGSGSLMGRYLYLGVIFADSNPQGFAGPSVKFGWGKTGKKLNVSYIAGTKSMSLEAGVSYIKQESDATLPINIDYKGYALEAGFRLNAVSFIGVFGKENSSLEFGIGF